MGGLCFGLYQLFGSSVLALLRKDLVLYLLRSSGILLLDMSGFIIFLDYYGLVLLLLPVLSSLLQLYALYGISHKVDLQMTRVKHL